MFGLKKLFAIGGATAAIAAGALAVALSSSGASADAPRETIPNELIDYPAFREIVERAEGPREQSRLTEPDFLAAMEEPTIVLLDARSSDAFDLRHISGAVNLPYTDWTEAALARVIPTKDTKILIYCNNNFLGSQQAFPTKAAPASLNLLSFTSLIAYGYSNIYELGPVLSTDATLLRFSGTEVESTPTID